MNWSGRGRLVEPEDPAHFEGDRPWFGSALRIGVCGALTVIFGLTMDCHHQSAKDPDTFIGRAQSVKHHTSVRTLSDAKLLPSLRSYVVVALPDKSVGPFLARKDGGAMGAYLGPSEGGARRLVSLPMGFDGLPKEPKVVATALADSTMLVLRPTGGKTPSETPFVMAWTGLTDRGEALSVVGVGADGAPSISPIELERTNDDIVWVEVTPQPRGELCVWAEETRDSNANIFAVALDPNGRPRDVPSRVARGVTAWQVVPTQNGAGLALVTPAADSPSGSASSTSSTKDRRGSSIAWLKLDAEARPVGTPTPVATSSAEVTDLDAVTVGDSVVLAWTDHSQPDPDVWLAGIDSDGRPKPAHAVTLRSGGARLAAIAGGTPSGIAVWEEARSRPRQSRRLHLAKIEPGGALGVDSAVIESEPSGTPEVAVLGDGFALLTRARTCPDSSHADQPVCPDAATTPLFVRFDLALHVAQTEPIRLDEGAEVATLAWGLACEQEQCLVLAAGSESPAKVRAVELTEMPNRWRPPVPVAPTIEGPKVLGVDTIQAGDLYADVAAAATDDGTLVAAVTADGDDPVRGSHRGATVSVRPLDTTGAPRGPSTVLTRRALAVGGVSIAAGPRIDGALVAWTGREGQTAQVHLTRIDRIGRRTKEVCLTNSTGDTNDVAVAWSGGGWLVAWVDTRDGNGEVYATKVDRDLHRIAREERITNAPGDASDVTLLGRTPDMARAASAAGGGDVWVTWADPRDSPRDGFADIFVAKLSAVSAKAVGSESRVLATAAHSRSPSLAWKEDERPAIAWIEEAPMGTGSENSGSYGAMIGALDEGGHLVGDVIRTHGAGDGFPTSVAIERGKSALRVVLARAARDDLYIDAIEFAPGRPGYEPTPSPLFMLDGPPSLDVSLSIVEGAVFFNDAGTEVSDGRTRRLDVTWAR